MKPADLSAAMAALLRTRTSIYVEGPPGLGKSSIIFQAAASIYDGGTSETAVGGFPNVDWFLPIRGVDRDPIDFRGVLYVSDGKSRWTTPDLIELLGEDGGVICIEELPQAVPAVQCVLRELLLERAIAGHRIPDTWSVVATGNRQEDRAGAGRLLSHVASAVVMLELQSSEEDWQRWAIQRGIHPEIRSFIRFKPEQLHQFDPARKVNADPRGWERLSNILDAVPKRLRYEVFSGTVGEGAAAGFIDFCDLYSQLPDPDEILRDPEHATIPSEASVRWALSGSIVERCRIGSDKTLEAATFYARRLPAENAAKMFVDLTAVNIKASYCKALVEFAKEHPEVFPSRSE